MRTLSPYEKLLLLLFFATLPLMNPWVRGDGVGYYAYARALLIDHNLRFEKDYLAGNPTFVMGRADQSGRLMPQEYTRTGYVQNHFSVGPAILWSPFLVVSHLGVLTARALGSSVAADGFSAPYRIAMALGTAMYGFLGLWISFHLARRYCAERWALLATLGVWWASSLPVYMYFNPSWSHAHSAFAVALFVWYWHRTHETRTAVQWMLLGAIAGLMLNVYYLNVLLLAIPGVEVLAHITDSFRSGEQRAAELRKLSVHGILFASVVLICLLPTWITRKILYGSPFESGYIPLRNWLWGSPAFGSVLFSSNHGLFSWTPLLLLAAFGLFVFAYRQRTPGRPFLMGALAFYFWVTVYPDWDGLSSFGNRLFVSLTPLFILGLAVAFAALASCFSREKMAGFTVGSLVCLFILWNLGFIFQWGTHLVPARGPISWREMVRNQFCVVPVRLAADLRAYLLKRAALMEHIEREDVEQLKRRPAPARKP